MYRKYFFISLVTAIVLVMGGSSAFAQATGIVRGKVMLKQADGKTVPAPGAVVDVYRLEVAGKQENIKTNKRGEFQAIGLLVGGKYILSISAPNAAPFIRSNIKPGMSEEYVINLDPGNGQRYTMEEAKKLAVSKEDGSAGSTATGGGESAEAKADREEKIRKNAEITASNMKVEEINALYNRAAKEGGAAYTAKRYPEAIAIYSEAITADTEHPGAPAILTNRSIVLRLTGVDKFNAALQAKDADGKAAAKADWTQSYKDATMAVARLKAQPPPADASAAANHKDQYYRALLARASIMKLYVPLVDQKKIDEGFTAYQEYLAAEPDAEAKSKMQLEFAQMLFDAGAVDKSVVEFQKILEASPDNVEAMLGAGLSLFSSGDNTKYQEAANYLQRFVDKAPDTHALKADAKAVLENLKSQNVKPQKGNTGGRRRG
ncbi:MAG: tetratricopeptide repeat protein [Pyrinomonadaceae bacterium]|nr:tetratricopeptide repeat protein [Pyrinomonadaceae bacterium]